MTGSEQEPGRALYRRLWTTKGCRFAARERLRFTNILSITSVTALSIYVIASSIVILVFADQLSDNAEKWLNIAVICISILIIAFSLIEFSRDHAGSAEVMNISALNIGEIYGRLNAKMEMSSVTLDDRDGYEVRYAEILREAKLNHTESDLMKFKLMNFREFKHWWLWLPITRVPISVGLFLYNFWIYVAAIAAYPILVVLFWKNLFVLSA